ncbi:signal peptidase I [Candidatus Izemoplasma sp. B36]|uniref:signal peptidase I n=1 Tax=Candidatus Izemoplasma sp. B36 TaxID=3242468 RepID=UPI003558AD73
MSKKDNKNKKSNKILNIVFWVVLALVAIYALIALFSNSNGPVSFFGRTAYIVQSDSMSGTFEKGDLIFVDTDFEYDEINPDDVITYNMFYDFNGDGEDEWGYNTHRVVQIIDNVNGEDDYITNGDANPDDVTETVAESYIVGIWTGNRVRFIGSILDFIKNSTTGFFIFIVVPCFAFLIFEIYKFIQVVTEYKTQQALSDRVKLQEEALALARAQLEEEARLQAIEKEKEQKKE